MNSIEKSVFNLIEIFRTSKRQDVKTVISASHCDQKYHHDFYCDAEKPYVKNF